MKKFILPILLLLAFTADGQGVAYSGGYTTRPAQGGPHGGGSTTYTTTTNNYQGANYNSGVAHTCTSACPRNCNMGRGRGRGRGRGNYTYGNPGYVAPASCATRTRVITRPSPCGTFYWRITQEQVFTNGYWSYFGGCRRWVPGSWAWQTVHQNRVFYNSCGGW